MKSWVVEVSNDKSQWEIVNEHNAMIQPWMVNLLSKLFEFDAFEFWLSVISEADVINACLTVRGIIISSRFRSTLNNDAVWFVFINYEGCIVGIILDGFTYSKIFMSLKK